MTTPRQPRRRGNGEGSITHRADGRWQAQYTTPNHVRHTLYARTRAEAAEKLRRALQDRHDGASGGSPGSVAEFLARWLQGVAKPAVRPATYRTYAQIVQQHLLPAIGHVPLHQLGPSDVQQLLAIVAAGHRPKTVANVRGVLTSALTQAQRWGLVQRNAASLTDPPRQLPIETHVLDPVQARRFLAAISGHRLEAAFRLAIGLGLRQGELLGLRWQDVDFEAGVLHVRHAMQRIEGAYQLVEPKTSTSRRTLPLSAALVDVLRRHHVAQLQARADATAWQHLDLVFCTADGSPQNGKSLTEMFQKVLATAALPPLRFHDLRHTAATLLLVQGVADRTVMDVLGHSTIGMTARYTHVIPAVRRQAIDALDSLLSEPSAVTSAVTPRSA